MYTYKLATCIQADMSVSIQKDKDHTLLVTEQRQGLIVFTKVCQAVPWNVTCLFGCMYWYANIHACLCIGMQASGVCALSVCV